MISHNRRFDSCWFRSFALLLLLSVSILGRAQTAEVAPCEQGKFRLHKFAQAIGEESYSLTRQPGALTLTSQFLFTDRGTPVPLKTALTAGPDYRPRSFTIEGKTCRFCTIDWEIKIDGKSGHVRKEKEERAAATPAEFFTIAGYAPVAMQMAMIRYWRLHGSPRQLAMVPSGQVEIQDRGADDFDVAGRRVHLRRYTVRGLIWGMETLWMEGDNLAALVSTDAEFDHFEAVRD